MSKLIIYGDNAQDIGAAFPGAHGAEMKKFPDGELYVRVPENCKGKDVLIIHRCYPEQNDNLMKLYLLLDAVYHQAPSSIKVFIPYLPYARMDKQVKEGESISADTVCRLLMKLGCNELITVDCHFIKQGAGNFERAGLKIRNLTASDALLAHAHKTSPHALVISPDQGAAYMAKGGESIKKVRGEYSSLGGTTYRKVAEMQVDFDAKGKDLIIIDDMVSTGSTMIKATKVMKEAGAKKISCVTSHGLFLSGALEKLKEAGASEVAATDSIPTHVSKVKVADLLKNSGAL